AALLAALVEHSTGPGRWALTRRERSRVPLPGEARSVGAKRRPQPTRPAQGQGAARVGIARPGHVTPAP
ncbi:hypothetical protein, partial [Streptomyces sp. SID3343]|uniref:hypothetical protein n=1 Tax=Streptomyces sp. SID3343 TaxID=2690260 RepID=UPI001F2EB7EE